MRIRKRLAVAGLALVFGTGATCHESLIHPVAGSVYTEPQTVQILAQPSLSGSGYVERVEFLHGGQIVAIDSTPPYSHEWVISDAHNGPHSWRARTIITGGSSLTTEAVDVVVDIEPSVGELGEPRLVGFLPGIGTAVDVAVEGAGAFVASSEFGLSVTSTSGGEARGASPLPLSGTSVSVSGDRAAVVGIRPDGQVAVQLQDVSVLDAPVLLGEFSAVLDPANAADVAIGPDGSYAVAAMGEAGLWLIDFSNPVEPRLDLSFPTPGFASAVALAPSGDVAYVTDQDEGLLIVALSGPGAPLELARMSMPLYSIVDIAVEAGIAYLANAGGGIRAVDVSNPSAPQLVGGAATTVSGLGISLAVDGSRLAVVGGGTVLFGTVLEVFDLATPNLPLRTGLVRVTTQLLPDPGVAVAAGTAYVASGDEGVKAYDLSSAAPALASVAFDSFRAIDISGGGGLAVVLGEDTVGDSAELRVLDVSADQPLLLGRISTGLDPANAGGVAVNAAGTRAVAALGTAGIWVIDLADPTDPKLEGSLETSGAAMAVALDPAGQEAYVADGTGGLVLVDLSVPSQPQERSQVAMSGFMTDVVVDGGFAYLSDADWRVKVVDVSDPDAPVYEGSSGLTMGGAGLSLAVHDERLVVLGGIQFEVFDLSDPADPSRLATVPVSSQLGAGQDVALVGGRAYLAMGSEGLKVYDISDPAAAVLLSELSTLGEANAIALELSSLMACVADGLSTVDLVDLAAP